MEEKKTNTNDACPNCGSTESEIDSTFCQTCGAKLDSSLLAPPAPPTPCEPGKIIGGRFVVQSLLWTAPTYNAYDATVKGSLETTLTIIEQRLNSIDSIAGASPVSGSDGPTKVSGSLEEAAPAFERFGLLKPVEQTVENNNLYIV